MFGLGYTGVVIARAGLTAGFAASGTVRIPPSYVDDGVARVSFALADDAVASATHLLCSVPPDSSGDPVLSRYGDAIAAATRVRWIGYLSTTGVYGNRNGEWVDEDSEPAPTSDRGRRRVVAEQNWQRFAGADAPSMYSGWAASMALVGPRSTMCVRRTLGG